MAFPGLSYPESRCGKCWYPLRLSALIAKPPSEEIVINVCSFATNVVVHLSCTALAPILKYNEGLSCDSVKPVEMGLWILDSKSMEHVPGMGLPERSKSSFSNGL